MPLLADRVRETTTSQGTGTISLAGAVAGHRTFVAGIGTGQPCYYAIVHQTPGEWEVGLGTVTDATPDTLSRATVLASSNAGALVNFSAGTKDVFIHAPASLLEPLVGHPDQAPSAPTSQDDEFDASSLNAKWTQTLGGTSPTIEYSNTWRSHLLAKFGAANGSVTWAQTYAPAGDFSLTGKLRVLMQGSTQAATLWAANTAFTEGVHIRVQANAGAMDLQLTSRDASVNTVRATLAGLRGSTLYLHLQRVGTTWSAWVSYDGHSFARIGTYTKTATINTLRLDLDQAGSTIPVWAGWDWIRRDWRTF